MALLKTFLHTVVGILYFILALLLLQQPASAAFRIAIDPGHGGTDSGATYNGLKESTLVLQFAQRLQKKLETDERFEVFLTRTNDTALSLPQRVHSAEGFKADLFLSLHLNASSDSRAKGTEFFFQSHVPIEDATPRESQERGGLNREVDMILGDLRQQSRQFMSLGFVRMLHDGWFTQEPKRTNAVRQAPFFVITRTSMPSALIEIGFLSNHEEAQKLTRDSYQEQFANSIYDSLTNYHDHFKKNPSPLIVNQ